MNMDVGTEKMQREAQELADKIMNEPPRRSNDPLEVDTRWKKRT